MSDLTPIARDAASRITPETWIQGAMDGSGGQHCAHGWVTVCSPQPGDANLVRTAMRHRGLTEKWNDAEGRTAEDVAAALEVLDVDAALADLWGETAPHVIALVRAAGSLAPDQMKRLTEMGAVRDAASDAAWDAAGDAAWAAAWDAAWAAAWDAARSHAARSAARSAALALALRDLVREGTPWDRAAYDRLTSPWRQVVGPVHPDDLPVNPTGGAA